MKRLLLVVLCLSLVTTFAATAQEGTRTAEVDTYDYDADVPESYEPPRVRTRGLGLEPISRPLPLELPAELARYVKADPEAVARTRAAGPGEVVFAKAAPAVCQLYNIKHKALGTGSFVVDGTYIVTNQHVAIEKGLEVAYAVLPPKDADAKFEGYATVVALDYDNDLGLLKIVKGPRAPRIMKFGKKSEIGRGKRVYAIGHPQGIPWCMSEGLINATIFNHRYRYEGDPRDRVARKVILTQTPIDPGSSGGPLLDNEGQMLGVNAHSRGDVQISNYAIALEVVENFIQLNAKSGGAKPKPSGEDKLIEDPKIIAIEKVFLSSEANWDKADAKSPINVSDFFSYVHVKFHKDLAASGFAFTSTVIVAKLDAAGKQFKAIHALEDAKDEIKWEKMAHRRRVKLPGDVSAGRYRVVTIVTVGKYIASVSCDFVLK